MVSVWVMTLVDNYPTVQEAIDAAGPNGIVEFNAGKIYTVSQTLVGLPGQIWRSDGAPATIKRCDEIKIQLTHQPPLSSSLIAVPNIGPFTIGQQVTLVKNKPSGQATHDDGDVQANWIVSLYHSSVVLSKPPIKNFAIGDWLITNQNLAVVTGDDLRIENIIFDGNRENNNTYTAWEHQSSLVVRSAKRPILDGVRFIGGQGESLMLNGVEDTAIKSCLFLDGNGSGAHLSSTKNTLFIGCDFQRMNQQAQRTLHAEGAITWSHNNQDVTVRDNYISDCNAFAFGRAVAAASNRGIEIDNNTVENCSGFVDIKGGGDSYPSEGLPIDAVIRCNTVNNSGVSNIYEYKGKLRNVRIEDNTLTNSWISVVGVDNLLVRNNICDNANTPNTSILVSGCNDALLMQNDVTGGYRGIFIDTQESLAYASNRNIVLVDNDVRDTLELALAVGNPIYTWRENPNEWQTNYAECRDIVVMRNRFSSDKLAVNKALVHLGKGQKGNGPVFVANVVESSGIGVAVEGHTVTKAIKASMLRHNTITAPTKIKATYVGYDKDIEEKFNT